MKTNENQKGITLIALAITIIVLLILTGVSITMLTGQNGILNRAKEAKEKTELAQNDEIEKLQEYENMLNKLTNNLPKGEGTTPYLPDMEKFEKVENTDLNTGLVIREKATQSEYVWIEVPRTDEVYPTAGLNITSFAPEEYVKIETDLHTYTKDYRKGTSFSDTYYPDSTEGWFKENTAYNMAKQKMLKSVYQNGGFWVGRYEAGIEEKRTTSGTVATIPQSKENLYPYIYVTRTQANNLAGQVESGNYTSSLMYGVQWDLILKYIEEKTVATASIANKETARTQILKDLNNSSINIGNYFNSEFILTRGKFAKLGDILNWYEYNNDTDKKNLVLGCKKIQQSSYSNAVLLTTGATEVTKLQNIYDLAGNVWELTLEKSSNDDNPCVTRGGSYGDSDTDAPASYRNFSPTSGSVEGAGFRVSIY